MKPIFNIPFLITATITAGMFSQLTACGQTGPLYLPSKPAALSKPAQPPKESQENPAAAPEPAPVTK
ncbi:lipoprotein [Oxalobacteraceae bacterium R-40]|uniref:Lipoprotein n=1 Tax=Keguizhuia sedimenti TaxID=3064264 RepID=A0ABU1BPP4_9BURK|nr:lipoprotein [Oxalobacteraceae bacterium R-40]